ncbi:MAG: sugar phosphorylase [Treponema sp.]|jgi:sucrose phosphorylase|nr:sugar phosphorylase [Treponema sp.]
MKDRIENLVEFMYGRENAAGILPELFEILQSHAEHVKPVSGESGSGKITGRDALLICYGDMLPAPAVSDAASPAAAGDRPRESALSRLERFLGSRNEGAFSYLHILPFHPYSSDDGFSVIDYRQVDPRLGTWEDIGRLGESFRMAFDFVINHGSVKSEWFRKFLEGEGPCRNWYITRPAGYDYSTVTRPRTHPLLSPFEKKDGSKVWVWTTFSADQADYDFSRPEVFLEFIRIFLEYGRRGGRMLRLDAIAYLWKEDGTPCLHHPKTHAMVKLFRAIIDYLKLDMLLLTETNVPHRENISYFGGAAEGNPAGREAGRGLSAAETGAPDGPEAHLVYNFALPPLVLHAAISGDAGPLRDWAAALPPLPAGNCFLNFLASHDGVGLTPAKGLVDDADFAKTLEDAKKRGALVSMKSSPAGPVPYELNCSWADMVAPESIGGAEAQARAFLTSYATALALPGLPAVYFHSWIGSRAWREGPEKLGYNRAINREKPALDTVEKELSRNGSFRSLVYRGFKKLLDFRSAEEAFCPDIPCHVLQTGREFFALLRGPDSRGGGVLCVHNFSARTTNADLSGTGDSLQYDNSIPFYIPSLGEMPIVGRGLRWLAFDRNGITGSLEI